MLFFHYDIKHGKNGKKQENNGVVQGLEKR